MCNFCKREGCATFLINEAGGYGQPEMWACIQCLRGAEVGSILAEKRDRLYAEDVALAAGMYP